MPISYEVHVGQKETDLSVLQVSVHPKIREGIDIGLGDLSDLTAQIHGALTSYAGLQITPELEWRIKCEVVMLLHSYVSSGQLRLREQPKEGEE